MTSYGYPFARRAAPAARLSPAARACLAAALVLSALAVASTLFLLLDRAARQAPGLIPGFSADRNAPPSPLVQVVGITHAAVGLLAAAAVTTFTSIQIIKLGRRHQQNAIHAGWLFLVATALLTATGMALFPAAASRDRVWLWWLHVATAMVAPAAFLWYRAVSHARERPGAVLGFGGAVVTAVFVLMLAHSATSPNAEWRSPPVVASDTASSSPVDWGDGKAAGLASANAESGGSSAIGAPPLTATAGLSWSAFEAHTAGRQSILDPMRMTGAEGAASGSRGARRSAADLQAEVAYCGRCHADAVEQWSASAHRHAADGNPFYEAALRAVERDPLRVADGGAAVAARSCAGCHAPAAAMDGAVGSGKLAAASVGRVGGKSPPIAIGCSACHGGDATASGYGSDAYIFADAAGGTLRAWLHDAALNARPGSHQQEMLSPAHRASEFCMTCHAASPGERGLAEQFDRTAAAGRQSADLDADKLAVLYVPATRRSCQDCHMPAERATRDVSAGHGSLRSHRFHASDTALSAVLQQPDAVERAGEFLRQGWLGIELFALQAERVAASAAVEDVTERVDPRPEAYDIASRRPAVRPGERLLVDVVVRNAGGGHAFPGGISGAGQSWIEFSVLDDAGNLLQQSGGLLPDGRVSPEARLFSAVDSRNHPSVFPADLLSGPAQETSERIAPGGVALARYRFAPPPDAAHVTLRARLMWRRFNRRTTEWAFATAAAPTVQAGGASDAIGASNGAAADPGARRTPQLPIIEICRHEVTLPVSANAESPPAAPIAQGTPIAQSTPIAQGTPGTQGAVAQHGVAQEGAAQNGIAQGAPVADAVSADTGSNEASNQATASPPKPLPRIDPAEAAPRYSRYALGLMQDGDLAAARRALETAERLMPRHADILRGLARLAVLEGRPDAAYEQLARCEETAPDDADSAWLWGVLMQRDRRFAEAAAAFQRALQAYPQDYAAWRRLARCCFEDGQHERAIAAFRRVLSADPTDSDAYYHVMQSARALKRTEESNYAEIAYLKHRAAGGAGPLGAAVGAASVGAVAGADSPSAAGDAAERPTSQAESVALRARELTPVSSHVAGEVRPNDATPGEPIDR